MFCSIKNSAERRYVMRMWISAALCVLFSVVALWYFGFYIHTAFSLIWGCSSRASHHRALIYTGVYLAEEKDEFQRNLLVQSLLAGREGFWQL